MKPICIIPASGASTRFPKKNIALLNGKPLLAYTIEAAIASNVYSEIYASSEDDEILSIAEHWGATPLLRPVSLSSDRAQVRHVCMHILETIPCEEFGVLGIPNPLRTAKDIKDAYYIFKQSNAEFLISVSEYAHPPQSALWVLDGYLEPYFDVKYMQRSQLLDTVYRCDGSIKFLKTTAFRRNGDFFGLRTIPFMTPKERSADIDYIEDLEWVKWKLDYAK